MQQIAGRHHLTRCRLSWISLVEFQVIADRRRQPRRGRNDPSQTHRRCHGDQDSHDLGFAGPSLDRSVHDRPQRTGCGAQRQERAQTDEEVDLRSQHLAADRVRSPSEHKADRFFVIKGKATEEAFDFVHGTRRYRRRGGWHPPNRVIRPAWEREPPLEARESRTSAVVWAFYNMGARPIALGARLGEN